MLLAMNRRLRRTRGSLAMAFALALAIGPELAEAQVAQQGTSPAAPAAPRSPQRRLKAHRLLRRRDSNLLLRSRRLRQKPRP
jgi:hypothetical protein